MPIRSRSVPCRPIAWHRIVALCAVAALCAPRSLAQDPAERTAHAAAATLPADRTNGAQAVTVAMCKQWLGTLASPAFEGRGTGQPGYQKAADFVAAHFRSLGLVARDDQGSYFQPVAWNRTTVGDASIRFAQDGKEVLVVPAERLAGSVSAATDAEGPVLLLNVTVQVDTGNRGVVPQIPGLADVDADGKIVVVAVRGDGRAQAMARFAVMQGLQGKNAAAVVFLVADAVRGGLTGREGMARNRNPAAAAAANRPLDVSFGGDDGTALLATADQTFVSLAKAPLAIPLPLTGHVKITVEDGDAPAMNVFAVLPGSDPKLRDEYVVIGSHLDHLGIRRGELHPGADDDGSGTTGVMAVAQMFAKNPTKPRRSVLFVCFSGEESGLVGSRVFVENCPIPLAAIAAELQMDMIGRDEEEGMDGPRLVNQGERAEDNRNSLHLVGTEKLAPALHQLCLLQNERAGFDLEYDQEGLFSRSDHANFARQGVPIAFFFTGLHRDYHQPSDTPDKIHYEKLLRVATYVYDIAFELASQDARPEVDPELWATFRTSSGNRRSPPPEQPSAPVKKSPPGDGNGK